MECPKCGYLLDDLDDECPRCRLSRSADTTVRAVPPVAPTPGLHGAAHPPARAAPTGGYDWLARAPVIILLAALLLYGGFAAGAIVATRGCTPGAAPNAPPALSLAEMAEYVEVNATTSRTEKLMDERWFLTITVQGRVTNTAEVPMPYVALWTIVSAEGTYISYPEDILHGVSLPGGERFRLSALFRNLAPHESRDFRYVLDRSFRMSDRGRVTRQGQLGEYVVTVHHTHPLGG